MKKNKKKRKMTINCRLFFVVVVMELSLFGIVKTHGQGRLKLLWG